MPNDHTIQPGQIFVFGSNLGGRHSKGAALDARQRYGAIYGQSEGRQGNSYAIPTKDGKLRTLHLGDIKMHVATFFRYARLHWDETFFVTAIGTGLAGYRHDQIAPLFRGSPANCILPPEWIEWLKLKARP